MFRRPGDARLDDIHGLKPFMIFAPDWKLLALIILAMLALGLLVRWWLGRRVRPVAAPEVAAAPAQAPVPARSALRQLDELAQRKLIEADRPREFHAALSGLMRAYLGARFALPARRLTTTELLAALGGRQVDEGTRRALVDILPGCDLAKFAGHRPGPAEMEARLRAARGVIETLGDLAVPGDDEDGAPRPVARAVAGEGAAS